MSSLLLFLKIVAKVSGQVVSGNFEAWLVRLKSNTTFDFFVFVNYDVIHTVSIVLVGLKTRSKIFPRARR